MDENRRLDELEAQSNFVLREAFSHFGSISKL